MGNRELQNAAIESYFSANNLPAPNANTKYMVRVALGLTHGILPGLRQEYLKKFPGLRQFYSRQMQGMKKSMVQAREDAAKVRKGEFSNARTYYRSTLERLRKAKDDVDDGYWAENAMVMAPILKDRFNPDNFPERVQEQYAKAPDKKKDAVLKDFIKQRMNRKSEFHKKGLAMAHAESRSEQALTATLQQSKQNMEDYRSPQAKGAKQPPMGGMGTQPLSEGWGRITVEEDSGDTNIFGQPIAKNRQWKKGTEFYADPNGNLTRKEPLGEGRFRVLTKTPGMPWRLRGTMTGSSGKTMVRATDAELAEYAKGQGSVVREGGMTGGTHGKDDPMGDFGAVNEPNLEEARVPIRGNIPHIPARKSDLEYDPFRDKVRMGGRMAPAPKDAVRERYTGYEGKGLGDVGRLAQDVYGSVGAALGSAKNAWNSDWGGRNIVDAEGPEVTPGPPPSTRMDKEAFVGGNRTPMMPQDKIEKKYAIGFEDDELTPEEEEELLRLKREEEIRRAEAAFINQKALQERSGQWLGGSVAPEYYTE